MGSYLCLKCGRFHTTKGEMKACEHKDKVEVVQEVKPTKKEKEGK